MSILENTDQFRLDHTYDEKPGQVYPSYRLANKKTNEEICFSEKDCKRWENAWDTDKKKHPNSSLNQRFNRLWQKFHKLAKAG